MARNITENLANALLNAYKGGNKTMAGQWLQWLSEKGRPIDKELAEMTLEKQADLLSDWRFWGRFDQQSPQGEWRWWVIMAGRGWGKTRTGAEWIHHIGSKGLCSNIALVARTPADARDTMIEGRSGIRAIAAISGIAVPTYEPSKRRLVWPCGTIATTYSGENPDQLRGPQYSAVWMDELAAYQYAEEVYHQVSLSLRIPFKDRSPTKGIITTTPRPTPLIRSIMQKEKTVITRGATFDNQSNLDDEFIADLVKAYEGTRMARQELYGEILDDITGALWNFGMFIRCEAPLEMSEVVVAVDPAVTSTKDSDETGIVVCGKVDEDKYYVLADYSLKGTPAQWGAEVARARRDWSAKRVVVEGNQGGDLLRSVLLSIDETLPIVMVNATTSKTSRAEPVAALYEQGKVYHCGHFKKLEAQMCEWAGEKKSPDRMDALVWGLAHLSKPKPKNKWIVI